MGKIESSVDVATSLTLKVSHISLKKGQQATISKSTFKGMKTGGKVNNQLLSDLSELIDCVQIQSKKFPKIAEIFALKDSSIKF